MPLSFPSSPTVGQTSTQANGRTYTWSGAAWQLAAAGSGGSDSRFDYFKPLAPTNVTATPGNAQAVVSWTASTTVNVLPVTDYVVQYSSNSGSTWTTFSDGTSATASATVTGLTNGTAYTFRVAAVNAIGQGAWSSASSSVTPNLGDEFWSSVKLLISGDGTNGSTSFSDSSASGVTITNPGGTVQKSATTKPFATTATSGYTNSGQLEIPGTAIGVTSSQDFAVDLWFYIPGTPGEIVGHEMGFNSPSRLIVVRGSSLIAYHGNSGGEYIASNVPIASDTWHYLAYSRSSGTLRMYFNGSKVDERADEDPWFSNGPTLILGRSGAAAFYFDQFRITVGSARGYTGSTITVPTAPFLTQ